MILQIKFKGIDSWNRPVFKAIEKTIYFGSVTTLFDYSDDSNKIIDYFKNNINELEYFGNKFDCEPNGGMFKGLELKIVE
jgi:hypothetical protein